jgi:predicted nucleic acid-binding protein
MLVVSDATPLNVLIRTQLDFVLPRLFTHVVVPVGVAAELSHERTPAIIREWFRELPAWIEVRAPAEAVDETLKGRGERQAVSLAIELRADLLLVDDKDARRHAAAAGLETIGTLGTLQAAADQNIVDLATSIQRVQEAGLFLSQRLIDDAIRRSAERRQRPE